MTSEQIKVGLRFEISYAHWLPRHGGKCKNLHGHNGICEIVFKQSINYLDDGMVMDFSLMKNRFAAEIKNRLDHKYLNECFDWRPTAENTVIFIKNELKAMLNCKGTDHVKLHKVKFWEDRDSYAEWEDK